MNEHTFFFFFSFLLIITTLPQSHSHPCMELPYNCGNLSNIWYPFWGENRPSFCGGGEHFMLNCNNNETTTILIQTQNFTILNINIEDYTIKMKRTDLDIDVCSPQFNDTYLNPNLFQYPSTVRNITIFYYCSSIDFPNFMCGDKNAIYRFGVEDELLKEFPLLKSCRRRIQVPVEAFYDKGVFNRDILDYGLYQGFEVKYIVNEECVKCLGNDLQHCSWDWNRINDPEFCRYIYCEDVITSASDRHNCSAHKHSRTWNLKLKLIVGGVSAVLGALAMFTIIYVYKRRKNSYAISYVQSRSLSSDPSSKDLEKGSQHFGRVKNDKDIEAFLKNYGALSQKRYKFSEVEKMTNSFKVKLGQGGFGTVYKGKLPNGSLVAVKVLKASKGNGEEFINEVASISRTSHVNIVNLLGFCFEGCKKALIYEFMPNGSLNNFIYNKLGSETITSLSWDNLDQIAKGIARGLEYLHRGCTTRILHFDIKPHNILLDENFCPKISDFGLAKLCPKKESIISMSDARGTTGYVAPEVWNRQFGGVSHKSDVYSYGMMLLEMVGGRKNINAEASHTSEIYYPYWVYTRLQLGSDLRTDELMVTEEDEIARRMTIVGLWCIQTFPTDRPTMSKVIEMLEGNMNSLEIPPKPLFSSPTRSE